MAHPPHRGFTMILIQFGAHRRRDGGGEFVYVCLLVLLGCLLGGGGGDECGRAWCSLIFASSDALAILLVHTLSRPIIHLVTAHHPTARALHLCLILAKEVEAAGDTVHSLPMRATCRDTLPSSRLWWTCHPAWHRRKPVCMPWWQPYIDMKDLSGKVEYSCCFQTLARRWFRHHPRCRS